MENKITITLLFFITIFSSLTAQADYHKDCMDRLKEIKKLKIVIQERNYTIFKQKDVKKEKEKIGFRSAQYEEIIRKMENTAKIIKGVIKGWDKEKFYLQCEKEFLATRQKLSKIARVGGKNLERDFGANISLLD